ncbi:hypothetical protein LCGC14_1220230 [marine sediment metagenome]|uniref:HNH nuclease domain-containing protein n=1 Tax=marine sediment metagenome TaxID=412755 RepID=A0A0F9NTV8_9ZZZZ
MSRECEHCGSELFRKPAESSTGWKRRRFCNLTCANLGRGGGQVARFDSRWIPEPNSGCWLWLGARTKDGYGQIGFDGKVRRAHRVAYKLHRGEIPAGLELDHLCRTRSCVNPFHLDPVTHAENVARGEGGRRTHCKRGHEFTPENTHQEKYGSQRCRACRRENYWRRKNA